MIKLLETFSLGDILFFGTVLFVAGFELYRYIKSIKLELKEAKENYHREAKEKEEMQSKVSSHDEKIDVLFEKYDKISKQLDLLTQSDKNKIKMAITKDHHYFCYKIGGIDDFSLDCIEKQYEIYQAEKGNSFVEDLMKDLRELPRISTSAYQDKNM